MNLSDIKEYLSNLSHKYDLIEVAKESCMVAINNCIKDNGIEELNGYLIDDLIIEFDNQKLIFNDWLEQKPYIKTRIGIYLSDNKNILARGLEPFGYMN